MPHVACVFAQLAEAEVVFRYSVSKSSHPWLFLVFVHPRLFLVFMLIRLFLIFVLIRLVLVFAFSVQLCFKPTCPVGRF